MRDTHAPIISFGAGSGGDVTTASFKTTAEVVVMASQSPVNHPCKQSSAVILYYEGEGIGFRLFHIIHHPCKQSTRSAVYVFGANNLDSRLICTQHPQKFKPHFMYN